MSKAKISELERVLEDCQKFLELVPIEALSNGVTWYPSELALSLGRRAVTSLNEYVASHLHQTRSL